LARSKEFAVSALQRSQALGESSGDAAVAAEQTEIAAGLKVWIQTPTIFSDWLELRKRSAEFARKFKAD
jgi:threonine synthase